MAFDNGELMGKDFKRLIGASIVGTKHETKFKAESVWRKVRVEFPEALQASTTLMVEDARAQWTILTILTSGLTMSKRT